jgi:hypothetical protein
MTTNDTAEDTRRLDAIREVLTRFDWQNGEIRLALEEIDQIAFGEHR